MAGAAGGAFVRVLTLPTSTHRYELFGAFVNWTQVLALALRGRAHGRDDRCSCATRSSAPRYRAIANDREITATLGVPVRRVEASAWLGSGLVCGAAGLLLADLYTTLDYAALTFLVISSLAAALIGRLQSLWVTLVGGLAVGLAQARARRRTSRSRATGPRRRSCSRSSRCSGSGAVASSSSRRRRG